MARDDERRRRAEQEPLVGGLPAVPGIGVAMRLTPGLGTHLRALADEVLVHDYPGATISRADRELLATAVSAANDCFYCMDSHGVFARILLEADGEDDRVDHIDAIKLGGSDGVEPRLAARTVLTSITPIARKTCSNDTPPKSIVSTNNGSDAASIANTCRKLAKSLPSTSSLLVRLVSSNSTSVRRSFSCATALAASSAEKNTVTASCTSASSGKRPAPNRASSLMLVAARVEKNIM